MNENDYVDYDDGYNDGHDDGFNEGYDDGFQDGVEAAITEMELTVSDLRRGA